MSKQCKTCRYFSVTEFPEQKVYGDMTSGFLWWKRTDSVLQFWQQAVRFTKCKRYPTASAPDPEYGCGEWAENNFAD